MTRSDLVIIGGHIWRFPPEEQEVDFPVVSALASSLNGRLTVVVRGNVNVPTSYGAYMSEVIYVPARWGYARLLWSAASQTLQKMRGSASSIVLTSDVLGAVIGFLATRRRGTLVVQVQGEILNPGGEYGGRLRRRIIGTFMRYVVRKADGVRCSNDGILQQVSKVRGDHKVVTIGSRVDTNRFGPQEASTLAPPRVVCVGSLIARKNQRLLIEALAMIREEIGGAELWLVGEGPMETELQQLVARMGLESAVKFLGHVPNSRLPDVLHGCSVFALPSLSEGEPRVVLEAQASGVPVVVSDIPATGVIVHDRATGRKIPDFDPSTWATILLELLRDQRQRDTLRANALERVRREHALEPWIDRFSSFLREVAGEA